MSISIRQWAIIAVVAVGFVVAVVAISSGDGTDTANGGDYDSVAWCQSAGAISSRSDVLDPSFSGDPRSELFNLNRALEDALLVAPQDLRPDLARMLDLAINVNDELASGSRLPHAITDAFKFSDSQRLNTALANINESLAACGHAPVTAGG